MRAYDRALDTLYQAPLDRFVAERMRLAAELRAARDAGHTQLTKRRRPTASAWVVNQLYWRARKDFDDMMRAAARIRDGDVAAAGAYRDALTTLRQRATGLLEGAGHKATDPLLRRVSTTLAAIAASGFGPDRPGTLVADRDPPGFEATIAAAGSSRAGGRHPVLPRGSRAARPTAKHRGAARAHRADERRRRAAEHAARARAAAERTRRRAERRRIEARLRAAHGAVAERERALAGRRRQLAAAEHALDQLRTRVRMLEDELRTLDERGGAS
jgi:hypothetical protein